MSKLRIHIGHHFFGSGNVGDDLMLAGFLGVVARRAGEISLTCCSPHDLRCQRLRFPQVDWLPYDAGTRREAISRCDVWLGLADTPFQATGGHTWFLDHLCEEAAWCREHSAPMFYLGVGVNEREVVEYPQMRLIMAQAARIWVRDELSVEALEPLAKRGQVTSHADLAHLALAEMDFPPAEQGILGLVLNFEDPDQYRREGLAALVQRAQEQWQVRWLAQEIRPLSGSETLLHAMLPPATRKRSPLLAPQYATAASARALLTHWEGVGALLASRYHASLVGAWLGARVVVFPRSDKVAGAARQLRIPTVKSLGNVPSILSALQDAHAVDRTLLLDVANCALEACNQFFEVAQSISRPVASRCKPVLPSAEPSMSKTPAKRILFLRPDAYGDLCLFEPVPRIIREAWPEAEVAVLIRQPYEDIAPVLGSDGVRWLTTHCNPFRDSPGQSRAALDALREKVQDFAPDCVVAACLEQTWLEAAVATFLPNVRQVGLGRGLVDPILRAALDEVLSVDWSAIYPEKVLVDPALPEWEKNLRMASALLDREAPKWWPVAHVPGSAAERATQVLNEAGLVPGDYAVCAAAGIANVRIKRWPADRYGEILAGLEHERGIRALLIGHVTERGLLEEVQRVARGRGGNPVIWVGEDGEMPVLAGLLASARFYFGNDTGALHLAAALGRPVLPIFGGGHWPRFQPVARRSLTVVQPLPCFGCRWDCLFADAPCVQTISAASVQKALTQFLADDTDEQRVYEASGLEPGARALIVAATPRLQFERQDSLDRLHQARDLALQVGELSRQLEDVDSDRSARLGEIEGLSRRLEASDADRAARLREVEILGEKLAASESDRGARLREIQTLGEKLAASEADRDSRLVRIEELSGQVRRKEAEQNRQIADFRALLKSSETDREARLQQVHELEDLLAASEADREARLVQIEALTVQLQESETDRAARLTVIQDAHARLVTMDAALREQEERHRTATAKLTPPPASGTPEAALASKLAHR